MSKLNSKTSKPIKAYSVMLSGQGDTFIYLVDEEVWDWILDPLNKKVPQSVIDYQIEESGDPNWTPNITAGTTDNDAALQCAPIKINGEDAFFFGLKEFNKFVRENKIDIIEEYEGYIY